MNWSYMEGEESGEESDDVEDEMLFAVKKPSSGRGTNGKRSRAAEYQNLSEIRRRDRINESGKWFWGSTLYHVDDLPFVLEEMPTNYGGFRERVRGLNVRKSIQGLERFKGMPAREDVEPGEIPTLMDLGLNPAPALTQAEALVKAQQDIAETMRELGLSFVKLVTLENNEVIYMSERSWAVDAKVVATAAVKASRFYRELNAQTIRHLQETLHEYTGLMLGIQNAFSERSNALLTVQTVLSDLASWHARAEKLEAASARIFGRNDSRIQRLEEIRRTIRITEDAKSCATREFEKIKENNRYELERFDKDRQDDFLNMLRGLATNQVGFFQKIADVWERVATETSHYAKDNC